MRVPSLKIFFASGIVVLLATFCLTNSSCKKFPTNSQDNGVGGAPGVYYGRGSIGGSQANVLLVVQSVDTLGNLAGQIWYYSDSIALESIYTNVARDSLWLRYSRDNTLYRAQAALHSSGITLHFTEPANITDVRMNRDVSGYNMSGSWSGAITTNALQAQRSATMTMDQQGTAFYGTVNTSFLESVQFELNSGAASDNSFQMLGIMRTGVSTTSTLFYGNYTTPNTITGFWQAGDQGDVDNGQFVFNRTF